MMMFGPLGFTVPWVLIGLVLLPILWWVLRAVPPAPIRRRFPGVALLLGLADDETQSDKTPWWLLLLRMLAVAAMIVGFAGPVLNPQEDSSGSGPLLIVIDGTWADALDWSARLDQVDTVLTEASRTARPVSIAMLSDPPTEVQFTSAGDWLTRAGSLQPNPWSFDAEAVAWAENLDGDFDSYWLSNGLDSDDRAGVLEALQNRGQVTVFETGSITYALSPARVDSNVVNLMAQRVIAGGLEQVDVAGFGLDPAGVERVLTAGQFRFDDGAILAELSLNIPPELRNRITRFELNGKTSAAAVTLADDSLKRREVALIAGRDDREGLQLLSPLHYLRQALEPSVDLLNAEFPDLMLANPDAIIMADVATISRDETDQLLDWIDAGGLLVRFAGPRLAASDVSRDSEHPLMPVRLRQGGRSVGGAMSWGTPKALNRFAENSPFFGLSISEEIVVSSQVMAQPDPNLSERVIATLDDGTPLVTRKPIGDGAVVLFHVTANAEWSSLPLSGLFVQMLERLAISAAVVDVDPAELKGTVWAPVRRLDAFGRLQDAGDVSGIAGEVLASGQLSADLPPGLYENAARRVAVNVVQDGFALTPALWPASVSVVGPTAREEQDLKGWVLSLALALLALDILASLWLSGRLRGAVSQVVVVVLATLIWVPEARAQADDFAITATNDVVLGYILTGDQQVDDVARAGLIGLSQTLTRRTSIEPAAPIGVNVETDELAFFPFLYWPVTDAQPLPSPTAYGKLNRYIRSGGMILFDTRDGHLSGFGSGTPASRKLQSLARPLDVPALEPIPSDHVLTRAFYLLQDFPGRHVGPDVWVEAAPSDAEQIDGMPFRNLNDGVTPVVIGGNDWAAAWAVLPNGQRMFPVGRGYAGERQREFARRFGVNLIMHVLTGNYKSDQVHVPALLERLGQ